MTHTLKCFLVLSLFASQTLYAESYKLGAILSLTGETANIGEACKNGIDMAVESLDADMKSSISVLYEDDELKTKNTISAFNKLATRDNIDAVLTFSSGTSKAIAPLADRRQIPLIAIASDPAVVKGSEYAFNLWVTPEEQVKHIFEEAKRRGYKKIARILATHDGTLAIRDAFDSMNNGQLEIVLDEEYPYEMKDFRPFITKLKATNGLDAVFVELFFGQTGLFAKQMRDLGADLPMFNIESFEDTKELEISDGALSGHWYVQADDPGEVFLKEYKEKYPDAMSYTAGNCHDALLLFAEAVKQKKIKAGMKDYFASVKNFKGAMGTFSATGDNRFSLPATIKVVTDSGFKKLNS